MADDTNKAVIAALARLEARVDERFDRMNGHFDKIDTSLDAIENEQRRVTRMIERIESKVDRVVDDMADLKVARYALDAVSAHKGVIAATQGGQIARLDNRVALIERRLELRDR